MVFNCSHFFVWEHEILSYEQIILNHRSNGTIYPELAQFCKPHFYPLSCGLHAFSWIIFKGILYRKICQTMKNP